MNIKHFFSENVINKKNISFISFHKDFPNILNNIEDKKYCPILGFKELRTQLKKYFYFVKHVYLEENGIDISKRPKQGDFFIGFLAKFKITFSNR